ncbi:MAG: outer membrane lipoprotein-sorting protein [candidate division WOR-3 bacterium]
MILLALLISAVELPDGNLLLARIDANIGSENKVIVATMTIAGRRGSRKVKVKSWVSGTDRSFTEYLAPERDKGTKMLKLGSDLWTYSPATDRTIRISGHMLRQSVSGSDLSYEDMMEDPKLTNLYTASTADADTIAGRPVWTLELTARRPDIAYQARRLWVDSERFIVLREERFSKSGKLLKMSEVLEVKRLSSRWVATRAVFRDALKTGAGTEFAIESIEFDAPIPDGLFTKASLRR